MIYANKMSDTSEQHVADVLNSLDDALYARLVTLRRWFHQHPELSYKEADTAGRIIAELDRLGISYRYAGVGHSVIADIEGDDAARPHIALRAEMDALPGNETTGAPYASVYPGRMHACGHGAHMAMLIGAAHLLRAAPAPGPVRLVFQPAEERGAGSRVAIGDGALENVSAIFAGHVTHEYEVGKIMVRDGDIVVLFSVQIVMQVMKLANPRISGDDHFQIQLSRDDEHFVR